MEGARFAEQADLGRLSELLAAAIATTPQLRGGHLYGRPLRDVPVDERLRTAVAQDDRLLLCGSIDEYTVGIALGSLDRLSAPNPVGVIEELYVEPDARSVGVGEALVDAAVAWFRSQGCEGVDLPALPGDRGQRISVNAQDFRRASSGCTAAFEA